jgi:hypothetical protein
VSRKNWFQSPEKPSCNFIISLDFLKSVVDPLLEPFQIRKSIIFTVSLYLMEVIIRGSQRRFHNKLNLVSIITAPENNMLHHENTQAPHQLRLAVFG